MFKLANFNFIFYLENEYFEDIYNTRDSVIYILATVLPICNIEKNFLRMLVMQYNPISIKFELSE